MERVDFDDMFLDDSLSTEQSHGQIREHQQDEGSEASTVVHRNKKPGKKLRKTRSTQSESKLVPYDLDDEISDDEEISALPESAVAVGCFTGLRSSQPKAPVGSSINRKNDGDNRIAKESNKHIDLDSMLSAVEKTATSNNGMAVWSCINRKNDGDKRIARESNKHIDLDSMLTSVEEETATRNNGMANHRKASAGSPSPVIIGSGLPHTEGQVVNTSKSPVPSSDNDGANPRFGALVSLVGSGTKARQSLVSLGQSVLNAKHTAMDTGSRVNLDDEVALAPPAVSGATATSTIPQAHVDLDAAPEHTLVPPTDETSNVYRSQTGSQEHHPSLHSKQLHGVPLGQPESPLQKNRGEKAVARLGICPKFYRGWPPVTSSVVFCIFSASCVTLFVVFGLYFRSPTTEEIFTCSMCPKGQEVGAPSFVIEGNSSVTMMQGLSCGEIESMASGGNFTEQQCADVMEQTQDVCQCRIPPEPTVSPTMSLSPTTHPTANPTRLPTGVPSVSPTTGAPSTLSPTASTGAPILFTPSPLPPSPPFVAFSQNRNFDRFNYRGKEASSTHNEFGPKDWGKIKCLDEDTCLGYPDTWEYANGWDINKNHCRWCPEGSSRCGRHHQSPIDLRRSFAIPGSRDFNECLDVHLMNFHDSTCTVEKLREKRAFSVARHALRILQPVKWVDEKNRYYLDCRNDNVGGMRFGRIDFSFGFSNWWYLSHTDFHVPSEHTQDGKRYDAEIQMYHFYSVDADVAGVNNEMGTVSVFLEAYDDAEDYQLLNDIICGWREEEERVRNECGLPSVSQTYPGCPDYSTRPGRSAHPKRSLSVNDILLQNHMNSFTNSSHEPFFISLEEEGKEEVTETMHSSKADEAGRRGLFLNSTTPWNNYFPLVDVGTEYYYRYSGTQTVPPCYGQFFPGDENRRQTNHWRVMKDPIRVSRRQITEMHRLIRERIAPVDDPVAACRPDTAAKVDRRTGHVNTARPIQEHHEAHFSVFCECQDWRSASETDKAWCKQSEEQRFFEHPYNFETNGF